jgi:hypothetical protein
MTMEAPPTQSQVSSEQQAAMEALSTEIARWIVQRVPHKRIVANVVGRGFTEVQAETLVQQIEQAIAAARERPEVRQVLAAKYKRSMFVGAAWAAGGGVLTLVTCQMAAARGGGMYVITWGPMVFGAIQFVRGLSGWLKCGVV